MIDIDRFIALQLQAWPLAANNFANLAKVESKSIGWATAQHNPTRIVSTGAKVDAKSLAARPCFLCQANRPAEQTQIDWGEYEILVNPYPIFPRHLTIPLKKHQPQSIDGRVADMCRLAAELPGFVVFYNGPKCGASAPDHMHFQAGDASLLPILKSKAPFGVVEISAATPDEAQRLFDRAYAKLPAAEPGQEKMMNVLCVKDDKGFRIIVIPRRRHRPSFYGSEPGQMLLSPASVDLGGLLIVPAAADYAVIDEQKYEELCDEVCYSKDELKAIMSQPRNVSVGVLAAPEIEIDLHGMYTCSSMGVTTHVTGPMRFEYEPAAPLVTLAPESSDCFCEVKDVVIGVNFHWERKEAQRFPGMIQVLPLKGQMQLINRLPVEVYLCSVISSEMSATSQMELLKSHAVISRSWLLAQMEPSRKDKAPAEDITPGRHIKWYDHDDHDAFDVCADDHCQRYQGTTRQTTEAVRQAVMGTAGEVLMSEGELCDARFSKSCGGAFEEFESCWEPSHKPYLIGKLDREGGTLPDLTIEENAREWILSAPEAFCNTADKEVLQQVLNGYDQETADFYRWTVEYDADTLAELVKRKSGYDFGRILELEPLKRGKSARIIELRIVGEKMTVVVGKELEIRRWLSESHLYSSAFVAEKLPDGGLRLRGAGWGHGVGLCQIGAAMMAHKGYGYRQILAHYYPGSIIEKI